jgi:hypothetical protein
MKTSYILFVLASYHPVALFEYANLTQRTFKSSQTFHVLCRLVPKIVLAGSVKPMISSISPTIGVMLLDARSGVLNRKYPIEMR